jgi:uncharacterized membrane protein
VFEIEETVAIDQPIERVWAFVIDETNNPLWQTTLTDARRLGDAPLGVGSRVQETRRFLGRTIETEWEMTECDEPRLSCIRSVKAPFAWSGAYVLDADADGDSTRFTLRLVGDPGGFFRLAEPLVERMARRELAGNVANLKDMLETGLGDPIPGLTETTAVS